MKRTKAMGSTDLMPPGQRFLTKPQMAAILQVSVRTLTSMIKRGEIPYLRLGNTSRGHLVRFRLDDVNRSLTETAMICHDRAGQEETRAPGGNCSNTERKTKPVAPATRGITTSQARPVAVTGGNHVSF